MSAAAAASTNRPALTSRPEFRISVGLAGAVLLLYARVAGHEFMSFDDAGYVYANPWVRDGFSTEGLRWAFTAFHSQNWHPLTWISHMLDCQLFGLDAGAHLIVNALLHASASVLLFLALRSMTGAIWASAIAAALFALHPLRVESVAWVSERKDVLSGCFWMLSLLSYARYVHAPSLRRYSAVFGSLALGLMAKPMLVTLPFVLLLLDVWPLGRARIGSFPSSSLAQDDVDRKQDSWSWLVLEKVPLLLLALGSSLVTIAAQSGVVSSLNAIDVPTRLANAATSYVAYLWSAIWPSGLTFYYPHPATFGEELRVELLVSGALAALLIAAVSAAVLVWGRSRPYLAVGWFWYLGTLLPVIGLLQVGTQARADRYTYLPMVGIVIALVWGLRELVEARRVSRDVLRGAICAVLAAYATASWFQIETWRDPATVFQHGIRAVPNNHVAHNGLGTVLEARGDYLAAGTHYQSAIDILPTYADARTNLGNLYTRQGDLRRAEAQHRLAIQLRPQLPAAHTNLGAVLDRQGRSLEAVVAYEEALSIDPGYAPAHYNMAVMLESQGRMDAAADHYRSAIRSQPGYADAHCNLGVLLGKEGRLDEAAVELRRALASEPTHTKASLNLAVVLARQGDVLGAERQLEDLLRTHPGFAPAQQALQQLQAQLD